MGKKQKPKHRRQRPAEPMTIEEVQALDDAIRRRAEEKAMEESKASLARINARFARQR